MIKVGIAGMGFMGWTHWQAYQKNPDVKVVAIATPEAERRAGDWRAIKGNFGLAGQQVDLTGIATYESLDQMLVDKEVDFVDLCLPPAMHRDAIVSSLAAGKDVFCEKPLALNLHDCDVALDAAKEAQKQLLVGHVLPFFNEFQFIRQAVDSGEYGRVLGGSFKRVISDPVWLKNFYDPQLIGGPLFDLHVHDAHFIRLLFGMPVEVHSVGRKRGQVVEYGHSIFRFADPGLVVSSTMGVIHQQGRPFTHGCEVHFERATLHFEFSVLADPHSPEVCPLKIFTQDGQVLQPQLGDGDPVFAFEREIAEVVRCLAQQVPSRILSGQLARDTVEICEMQARGIMHV
jgi:myo-inositol 2-dehydrogenase/D-chiro-inositol 1-dehydrogenase